MALETHLATVKMRTNEQLALIDKTRPKLEDAINHKTGGYDALFRNFEDPITRLSMRIGTEKQKDDYKDNKNPGLKDYIDEELTPKWKKLVKEKKKFRERIDALTGTAAHT